MCLAARGVIVSIENRPVADGSIAAMAISGPASGPQQGQAAEAPAPPEQADPLWRVAQVDFGGVRQQVSLACLPEARVGDRVLVHVGLALSLVEEEA